MEMGYVHLLRASPPMDPIQMGLNCSIIKSDKFLVRCTAWSGKVTERTVGQKEDSRVGFTNQNKLVKLKKAIGTHTSTIQKGSKWISNFINRIQFGQRTVCIPSYVPPTVNGFRLDPLVVML